MIEYRINGQRVSKFLYMQELEQAEKQRKDLVAKIEYP